MTQDEMEAARAKHPAGKGMVPKAAILNKLLSVVRENYWIYGRTAEHRERWNLRSMLDYAVLTHETGHFRPGFTNFYHHRNVVMECLINSINDIRPSGTDMIENYGDWRYWETHADRTQAQIERVILHALDFEVKAELTAKKK